MRTVIQRVKEASVSVEGGGVSSIKQGLLVLVSIEEADTDEDIDRLSQKIINIRLFDDGKGVMNRSLIEADGELLVVSQFTLHASTRKGNRPSYIRAANPDFAIPMYEKFIAKLETECRRKVQTGVFGAHMQVTLVNDGPVTIIIDTKQRDF